MKKYIKPSIEVTEVMLESAILAASNEVSSTLGIKEIDGTSSQALEMRNFSLWDDDDTEE